MVNGIKISQLNPASTLDGTESLPVVQNGVTVKATTDQIKTLSQTNVPAANITGTLGINHGGTGQTTANSAFNALAPSQTSNPNKFLKTDGTNTSWSTPSGSDVSIGVGLTSVTLGTSGRVLYDNAGSLGEYAISGTGLVALTGSPNLTGTPTFAGSTSGTTGLQASATASGTLTLPAATDTLVGKATTDTLTNKTISGADNTLSNIGNSSLTNSSITVNGTSISLGGSGTITAAASSVAVGTTTVTGGTTTRVLYDNAGTLGEYAQVPIANGGTGQATASAAFNALSPITSTGDLILGNGVNSATRLGIGSNGFILTSNGTTAAWSAAAAASLTVGTTSIASGTTTKVLYDNAGVLGEYTVSGSGNVAMTTSPTFTTPVLGTPTSGTLTNCTGLPFGGLTNVTVVPQGRLTLVTAVPVMTSAQTAKTIIYYTPYVGALIPIYDGTNWSLKQFSELSNTTTDSSTGNAGPAATTTNSNYDLFVWSNSGTLTLTRGPAWTSDTARGTGAGTTQLTMTNGIYTNTVAITNGPGANLGTYVGTVRTDGSSQVNWDPMPARAAGGGNARADVFNAYNRVAATCYSQDSTSSWTYSSTTWRATNNSTSNRISYIDGLGELYAAARTTVSCDGGTGNNVGIGINRDSTSATPDSISLGSAGNFDYINPYAESVFFPSLGFHYLQSMESVTGASTFYGVSSWSPVSSQFLIANLTM